MASSSCKKCVNVLRELISGLQESRDGTTGTGNNHRGIGSNIVDGHESPPLTLLKAIARGQQQHQQTELGGKNGEIRPHKQQSHPSLIVEDVEDGVRLTIPVETTIPTLLRRWTKLTQHHQQQGVGEEDDDNTDLVPLHHALATSASLEEGGPTQPEPRSAAGGGRQVVADPLVVELKCRKCASTGPEGGARAFLMGPQPLSVVLCHNRIASHRREVEEILTHELVHLYDVQTMHLDLQDCENLAYSEVRAAKAAECRDSWRQLQPYCVKQKAICATNNMFPTEGRRCIQRVFDTAFGDDRPFDGRQPNQNTATQQRHHGGANASAPSSSGR
jgi:hypothetical protein